MQRNSILAQTHIMVACRAINKSYRKEEQKAISSTGIAFEEEYECDTQEQKTDQRLRLHQTRLIITDNRSIVRNAVMDRSATSGTISQQIRSVAQQTLSVRSIRRVLQHSEMSARCLMLQLVLSQNPGCFCVQWQIGSRVGRNQATVRRICDRWMKEGTMDRRGRSHPPQCTTSREDRQIVCMTVTDRSVTSRNVAQHIESVTHHSVSARTIRRRLQQSGLSARRPLLNLPLNQNHRRLRQWCDERRMWVAE
ncbi:transposable element Tcb1 transposase [Trichonephila clavipes]|nr:transposable element Tcb1 transposase [Trichonephila clavipes]